METNITPVDIGQALKEFLKNNEGKISYKLPNAPGEVIEFRPNIIEGVFKEGDFDEGFNYSISCAPCTLSIKRPGNCRFQSENDFKFDCTIRLLEKPRKTDETGKKEIVCGSLKDNTIYIKTL